MARVEITAEKLITEVQTLLHSMDSIRRQAHDREIEELAKNHREFHWWRGSRPAPLTFARAKRIYEEGGEGIEDYRFKRVIIDQVVDDRIKRLRELNKIATRCAVTGHTIWLEHEDLKAIGWA